MTSKTIIHVVYNFSISVLRFPKNVMMARGQARWFKGNEHYTRPMKQQEKQQPEKQQQEKLGNANLEPVGGSGETNWPAYRPPSQSSAATVTQQNNTSASAATVWHSASRRKRRLLHGLTVVNKSGKESVGQN